MASEIISKINIDQFLDGSGSQDAELEELSLILFMAFVTIEARTWSEHLCVVVFEQVINATFEVRIKPFISMAALAK